MSTPHRPGSALQSPDRSTLRLIPLGGLGEIGMNCLALWQGDDILLVDCGVTFPTQDLGIDVIHPRFDFLIEHRDRVRGLVVTHGHEDHIGAIPYLLGALRIPIWAPRHATALIRARLDEHQYDLKSVDLREVRVRQPFDVGSFTVEAMRVTHSIADATALAIRTVAGVVVHTGDFKLDPGPLDGETTDEARLGELGDEGVRLLLSDSTGIDAPGHTRSETEVAAALSEHVGAAGGRVLVGMFPSNMQRLIGLGRLARSHRRRVCLLGRSAVTHARVGRDLGLLDWPSDLTISPEAAEELPGRDVLVIATGTQAEERAALMRLATGEHPKLRLRGDDTLILSSRIIPGNDRAVYDLMGAFLRQGIRVISRVTDPRVHASGHACRGEQERMIELTRPAAFVPVHGTRHHLTRHAELATELGIPEVLVVEDGAVVEIGSAIPPRSAGHVISGRVAIFDREPLSEEVLRDRSRLSQRGVVAVSISVDATGQRLTTLPSVSGLGVFGPADADVEEETARAVQRAVERVFGDRLPSGDALHPVVRSAARRCIEDHLGLRPEVIVLCHRPGGSG